MITVVNLRTYGKPKEPWEVYIGRYNNAWGMGRSILHNPSNFTGTREQKIAKFRRYFYLALDDDFPVEGELSWDIQSEIKMLRGLLRKHGKLVLICWCKPLACHGDVIKEYLEKEVK